MTNSADDTSSSSHTRSIRWAGQLQLTDVRQLSQGGHGEVHAAKLVSAEGISQDVVLKLARGQTPAEVEQSRRFLLQEARLTATFNHPNIIRYRDYNPVEIDGEKVPCLLMEHGGVPLSAVIHSHGGRLEPGLAAFVGVGVLAALAYSHSRDVIHRDVKPQNVLIGYDGQVRLCDYGVAKAADPRNPSTVVTNLKGTPVYISPEAYNGEKLDGRADIWSVGVMLFEMVIGRKPWEDDKSEPNEMVRLRRLSDLVIAGPLPKLPEELVPTDLAAVITKMLMKNRNDRYEDALQAMYALEKVAVRLVGPWAAARELSQQVLAASDPAARRRRPTLEESTVNVRPDRRKDAKDEYVSVVVRSSETGASMVVPPEMLQDEPSSEVVTSAGDIATVDPEGSEITAQLTLPPTRRVRGGFLKFGVVAASIVVAVGGAVFWSGGPGTVARVSDMAPGKPGMAARGAFAAAQPSTELRDELLRASGPLASAAGGVPVEDAKHRTAEIEPPKSDVPPTGAEGAPNVDGEAASDAPRSRREPRAGGDEARTDGGDRIERMGVGELKVVLIPRGSFVSLDGQPPVKAPITFHNIRQGSHEIRVGITERSLDRTEKVRVKAGEVASVELELANPFGD